MRTTKKELLKLIKENYSLEEDHLGSRDDKIEFILSNQYLSSLPFIHPEDLDSMPDEELDSLYNQVEDEMTLGQYKKKDINIGLDEPDYSELEIDDNELETEPVYENELSGEKEINEGEVNRGNVVNYIMDFEDGSAEEKDVLELFSYLIKSGMVNHLQGMYGRTARDLIDNGYLSSSGDILKQVGQFSMNEEKKKKPSAGLTKKKKSEIVKKAKKGEDIGKKGKGFKKVEAKAKESGAKDPKAVAAAAMWKNIKREGIILTKKELLEQFNKKLNEWRLGHSRNIYRNKITDELWEINKIEKEYISLENVEDPSRKIKVKREVFKNDYLKKILRETTEVAKKQNIKEEEFEGQDPDVTDEAIRKAIELYKQDDDLAYKVAEKYGVDLGLIKRGPGVASNVYKFLLNVIAKELMGIGGEHQVRQLNKKQNIKETTEVAKKHPSVINQERINKETAKETKQDRDKTFVKNMDKIVKGNDDFQYVNEPKFDEDSLKMENILDNNPGAVAEEGLEEYRIGGMGELRYDSKPKGFDERMEKDIDPVKGKRVYANSVKTDLGEKINKFNKKKIENKNKAPMYSKDIQPVKDVKENKGKQLSNETIDEQTKKVVKIEKKVNKLTEKINKKESELKGTPIKDLLSEEKVKELEKMKKLFNYKPSDYIKNK